MTEFWEEALQVLLKYEVQNLFAVAVFARSHALYNISEDSELMVMERSIIHEQRGELSVTQRLPEDGSRTWTSAINWTGGKKGAKCQEWNCISGGGSGCGGHADR